MDNAKKVVIIMDLGGKLGYCLAYGGFSKCLADGYGRLRWPYLHVGLGLLWMLGSWEWRMWISTKNGGNIDQFVVYVATWDYKTFVLCDSGDVYSYGYAESISLGLGLANYESDDE